jgi:CopG family nickel-responsive transcriptional regulator
MQRITISIDEALAEAFDRFTRARGYQSRSEGVRDVVREAVRDWRDEADDHTHCIADLSYIYDRRTRVLTQRLSYMQHAHHDLIISTHLVRVDHRYSMESFFLKGENDKVRAFADQVLAERGVRFGSINLVGVDPNDDHDDEHDHSHHGHSHLHPLDG